MSKTTEIKVGIKQGLPNYSSREASLVITAEEGEDLEVEKEIKKACAQIINAWKRGED